MNQRDLICSGEILAITAGKIVHAVFADAPLNSDTAEGVKSVEIYRASDLHKITLPENAAVRTIVPQRTGSPQLELTFAGGAVLTLPGDERVYFDVPAAIAAITSAAGW